MNEMLENIPVETIEIVKEIDNGQAETEPADTEPVADEAIGEEPAQESEEKAEAPTELELLKGELDSLRAELARRDALDESNKRMLRECEEFGRYFPNTALSTVPDEVWESVKEGIPLAASYALYEKKQEMSRRRADEVNQRNRDMSAGSVKRGGEEGFYSPSEVKAMTKDEVRANYSHIIESMRHWN